MVCVYVCAYVVYDFPWRGRCPEVWGTYPTCEKQQLTCVYGVCRSLVYTHGPRFMMDQLNDFVLYHGVKAIRITQKPSFRLWLLIFSWTSDMWHVLSLDAGSGSSCSFHSAVRSWGWTANTLKTTLCPDHHSVFHFQYSIQLHEMCSTLL